MATDKTIFELPDITLEILHSGVEISFVAQVQGYGLDFQVPLNVMAEYLNSGYILGVSGGSSTPDNAAGNNGDIYFKQDGKVYQKINGAWVIKATLPTLPSPAEIDVPANTVYTSGSEYWVQMNPDYTAYGNNPTVIFKQYQSGSIGRNPSVLKPLAVDYIESCFNGTLRFLKINFPPNDAGTGVQDHWMIVIK